MAIAEGVKWGIIGSTYDKHGVNKREYANFFNRANKEIMVYSGIKEDQKAVDEKWNRIKEEILRNRKKKK